ncbi:MAG: hypothetical protein U0528_16595 [Anaerolineae bacterium]
MAEFITDNVEITIKDGFWKAFNMTGKHTLSPFFTAVRGQGVINYTVAFGEQRDLPGNVLGVEFIPSVVVGFDENRRRWILGIQVLMKGDEKPRFVGLAQWPEGDNPQFGIDGQTAGRALAEYIGKPLKLFGVKKVMPAFDPRRTVTGPAVSHKRQDIEASTVQFRANQIKLPVGTGDIGLERLKNNNTLVLRNPKQTKENAKPGEEAPAYVQVQFDVDARVIKLVPPTGLLGAFFGPGGRQVKFSQVRNVEMRHIMNYEPASERDVDGTMIDVSRLHHEFSVYLTIQDESMLLTKMEHVVDPKTSSITMRAVTPNVELGPREVEEQVRRLKQLERDAGSIENKTEVAEAITLTIAAAIGCPVVKTTVGELDD